MVLRENILMSDTTLWYFSLFPCSAFFLARVLRSTKLLIARLIEFTSLQGEDIARFYRVRRRFESLRIFRRPYVERDEGWF